MSSQTLNIYLGSILIPQSFVDSKKNLGNQLQMTKVSPLRFVLETQLTQFRKDGDSSVF